MWCSFWLDVQGSEGPTLAVLQETALSVSSALSPVYFHYLPTASGTRMGSTYQHWANLGRSCSLLQCSRGFSSQLPVSGAKTKRQKKEGGGGGQMNPEPGCDAGRTWRVSGMTDAKYAPVRINVLFLSNKGPLGQISAPLGPISPPFHDPLPSSK